MFGISPLGWVHTLGSLPAIPLAVYMFARHGRIVPRSGPGTVYFVSMLIDAATVFLVASVGELRHWRGDDRAAGRWLWRWAAFGAETCEEIHRDSLPEPDRISVDGANRYRDPASCSGRSSPRH